MVQRSCQMIVRYEHPLQQNSVVAASVMLGLAAIWFGCAGPATAVVCGLAAGFAIRWIAQAVAHVIKTILIIFLGSRAAADRDRTRARAVACGSYELKALERRLESLNIINIGLAPKILPSPIYI
jgi:hypothetical protein